MSRKASIQHQNIELDADKRANINLIEARRRLAFAQRRSPSVVSIEGHGARSPVPGKEVAKGEKSRRISGASLASTTSEFKWVNIDGKGNWQKVPLAVPLVKNLNSKELEKKDDFKDEDLAGAVSGEETDQYWNELNENREKREQHLNRMSTTFIDIPEIIIVSEDVSLEHKEEITKCEVTKLEQDETVN
jgi:hypothetical protein